MSISEVDQVTRVFIMNGVIEKSMMCLTTSHNPAEKLSEIHLSIQEKFSKPIPNSQADMQGSMACPREHRIQILLLTL